MKEATKYQNVDNLWKLNIVFREYLALGWYWMKGYS